MQNRKIRIDNSDIIYTVAGEGDAVVLLHGFGEDARIWNNLQHIFDGFKVIIPDLPGSGSSGAVNDMSMEGLAEAVNKMLDEEKTDTCVLIGHSMGGYISLAFAEKYAERLKGLGLFHSSAFADNAEKIATRRKGISFIKENGAHAFLKTMIPNLYSSITKKERPQLIQQHIEDVKYFTNESLIQYYEAMINRPDRTQVLKNAKFPVLFILGREDQAVPIDDGLKQCHLPAISQVHILERSAHMGMVEETDSANQEVLKFLTFCLRKNPHN